MVRSNSLREAILRAKFSLTRASFSVSCLTSFCRRCFSSSSCWICRPNSSRFWHNSSMPGVGGEWRASAVDPGQEGAQHPSHSGTHRLLGEKRAGGPSTGRATSTRATFQGF